jgi:hypothetical protein
MANYQRMQNEIVIGLLALLDTDQSLDPAVAAYTSTEGDIRTRMAAALRVAAAVHLVAEPPLDLPEGWQRLSKQDLKRVVGDNLYLPSNMSTEEMRTTVRLEIRRRTELADLVAIGSTY